jgi:hypothetical protein
MDYWMQEVAGYAHTMETVFTSWEAIDLTENHVLQLHRDLLKYSTKDERHRGKYKTLPNDVAAQRRSRAPVDYHRRLHRDVCQSYRYRFLNSAANVVMSRSATSSKQPTQAETQ